MNSCDSLDGADVLLSAVPALIGMSASVSDLAATVFAARFYSAIASTQPVAAALAQGSVAVEMSDLEEGWMPAALARRDVDLQSLVLVQPMAV